MLALDKKLHVLAGSILASAGVVLDEPIVLGLALFGAFWKEVNDEFVYGGFDLKDLVATVAGAAGTLGLIQLAYAVL